MMRALWTSATGMDAQQTKIDVIANNLANVNTTAFKRGRAEFEDMLYQTMRSPGAANATGQLSPSSTQVGLGVKTTAISRIFAQGQMQNTANELDVAIEGKGFFVVTQPSGELAYTRNGTFKLNNEGVLTTPAGEPLEPQITIPPDALNVNIAPDGTVSVVLDATKDAQEVGTLQLARFVNPEGLRADGHNLYSPTGSSGDPITGVPGQNGFGSLTQGFLETSNVNMLEEMVQMIIGQRAYEINSKVVTTSDQMLQAVTRIV